MLENINSDNICDSETFDLIFQVQDEVKRTELIIDLEQLALSFNKKREFTKLFKAHTTKRARQLRSSGGNKTTFTNPPIENLKCGMWIADDSKIFKTKMSSTLQPYEEIASIHPILVHSIIKNIDENTEKIKLLYFKNDKWEEITVPRSITASNNKIMDLADFGIEVNSANSKNLVEYIADLVSLNEIPIVRGTERLGWNEDEFIPYTENIVYDGDITFKTTFKDITSKGDYKVWLEEMRNIRKYSKIAQLVLAVSFSSVLNKQLGTLPFILHLWGGTGSGKTVALMTAMSVWGDPEIGKLTRSLNSTHVAMTRYASFLRDLPFAGDELQTIKNRWSSYDDLVMLLGEGVDRARGKAYGGLETLKEWNCSFIFTGEEPICKANSGAGTKNRVLETETAEKIIEDGNRTSNLVRDNYGFAGKEFIKVLPKKEELQTEFRKIFEEVLKNSEATEKQAVICATVMLADRISSEHIFKDQPLEFEDIKPFLATVSDVNLANRSYALITDWITSNRHKFDDTNKFSEIYGKMLSTGYVAVLRSALTNFLNSNNIDFEAIKKDMAKFDYLKRNDDGKYTISTRIGDTVIKTIHIKYDVEENENEFIINVEE